MGVLNILFGKRSRIESKSKDAIYTSELCKKLWREHLENFKKREELAKHFNYANIDAAIADFDRLVKILDEIASLISGDIIIIDEEEFRNEEIIADLQSIVGSLSAIGAPESISEISALNRSIAEKTGRQKKLLQLFENIHEALRVQMHTINMIKRKPSNVKDILMGLFKLIFFYEAELYSLFYRINHRNQDVFDEIERLAAGILAGERLEEKIETAEEIFVRRVTKEMGKESRKGFRRLGEDVYLDVLEMIGAPFKDDVEIDKILKDIAKLCNDRNEMRKLIIKNKGRLNFTDEQVEWVVTSFIRAFNEAHFDELNAALHT